LFVTWRSPALSSASSRPEDWRPPAPSRRERPPKGYPLPDRQADKMLVCGPEESAAPPRSPARLLMARKTALVYTGATGPFLLSAAAAVGDHCRATTL
jgi:hypothetical protein